MRHLKAGRKLNRNASHRVALLRNLSCALIEHERIITTLAKAKALRPFIEKLITLAKKGTLHARRLAVARLHNKDAVAEPSLLPPDDPCVSAGPVREARRDRLEQLGKA